MEDQTERPTTHQYSEGDLDREGVVQYLRDNLDTFGHRADYSWDGDWSERAVQTAAEWIMEASGQCRATDEDAESFYTNPVVRAILSGDLPEAINRCHSRADWVAVPLVHGFLYNKCPIQEWDRD